MEKRGLFLILFNVCLFFHSCFSQGSEANRAFCRYGFVTFANADLARDAKLQDPPLIFMGKTLNCQSAYRRAPTSLVPRVTRPITPSPVYFSPMYCDANGYFYVVQSDGYGWYPPHGPYYSSPLLPPAQNALPYPTGGAIADRIQDCSPLPGTLDFFLFGYCPERPV
jgi:hypothetical protein